MNKAQKLLQQVDELKNPLSGLYSRLKNLLKKKALDVDIKLKRGKPGQDPTLILTKKAGKFGRKADVPQIGTAVEKGLRGTESGFHIEFKGSWSPAERKRAEDVVWNKATKTFLLKFASGEWEE